MRQKAGGRSCRRIVVGDRYGFENTLLTSSPPHTSLRLAKLQSLSTRNQSGVRQTGTARRATGCRTSSASRELTHCDKSHGHGMWCARLLRPLLAPLRLPVELGPRVRVSFSWVRPTLPRPRPSISISSNSSSERASSSKRSSPCGSLSATSTIGVVRQRRQRRQPRTKMHKNNRPAKLT